MGSNEERSLTIEENEAESKQIDPARSRFPCCIVWTPLPVLSWFFPCIGHIGICRDDGVILDFAGPNFVCVDNFAFGAPTRYLQLSKEQCCTFLDSPAQDPEGQTLQSGDGREIATWDDALRKSTLEYQHQSYNILTCNCHSFVANCLNRLKFQAGNWNVVNLAILIFMKGQFVSRSAILRTYLPFVVVLSLGLILGGDIFLTYLAIFICVLVGWFLLASQSTSCLHNGAVLSLSRRSSSQRRPLQNKIGVFLKDQVRNNILIEIRTPKKRGRRHRLLMPSERRLALQNMKFCDVGRNER